MTVRLHCNNIVNLGMYASTVSACGPRCRALRRELILVAFDMESREALPAGHC